jgi:hypothetical protein
MCAGFLLYLILSELYLRGMRRSVFWVKTHHYWHQLLLPFYTLSSYSRFGLKQGEIFLYRQSENTSLCAINHLFFLTTVTYPLNHHISSLNFNQILRVHAKPTANLALVPIIRRRHPILAITHDLTHFSRLNLRYVRQLSCS